MFVTDSTDTWVDEMSNCRPLEEHHYAEGFAVSASFVTDDPPSGAASSRPPPVRLSSEQTRDTAENATKTHTHLATVGTP